MDVLTNWVTFFKLWAYFTFIDIVIFMIISNFYINIYLANKEKKSHKNHKHINKA